MRRQWLVLGLASVGLCVFAFQNCTRKNGAASATAASESALDGNTRVPSPTANHAGRSSAPVGSVSGGSFSVLYDPAQDSAAGCQAVLDAQLIPMSFSSDDGTTAVSFVASKFEADGRLASVNVWGKTQGDGFTSFKVACGSILRSPMNDNPFQGAQWIIARFKAADQRVHAVLHDEYYGGGYPGFRTFAAADHPSLNRCPNNADDAGIIHCTYSSLNAAVSAPGGAEFKAPTAPADLIARPSFAFDAGYLTYSGTKDQGVATGYFVNTGMVRDEQGFHYMLSSHLSPNGGNPQLCVLRTADVATPDSWRGWDGSAFSRALSLGQPCQLQPLEVGPFYFGFSAYFGAFIAVGNAFDGTANPAVVFSLSADLIHWSPSVPLRDESGAVLRLTFNTPKNADKTAAPLWGFYNYPSLMDPTFLNLSYDANASSGSIVGKDPLLVLVDSSDQGGHRVVGMRVHFSRDAIETPVISEAALGCDDYHCGWVKGHGFSDHCEINLYAATGQVRITDTVCTDTLVTFRIPLAFQQANVTAKVNVVNGAGAWSELADFYLKPPK